MRLEDRTTELNHLHRGYLAPETELVHPSSTQGGGVSWLSDNEVIEKASNARNGDKFRSLWAGDTSAYGNDHSAADLALCSHLAFWCNRDIDQMDSLFRKSALMRPKWDERRGRQTYGERTIARAIASVREGYNSGEPEIEPSRRRHLLTDQGNARRFVDEHGEGIRYVPAWKKWLIWDDNHWRIDDDNEILRRARQTTDAIMIEAQAESEPEQRGRMIKAASGVQSLKRLQAMVELAKSEPGISINPSRLDANPRLLGCPNGVIELDTGIFREGRRDDYIIKQIGIPYRSGATCPHWLAFLDTVTEGDTELQSYIQRAVGYTLSGNVGEEVMFILYGGGSNGKTTFREILRLIMGDYALTASSDLLMERKQGAATNDVARLKGARLVSVNESQENDQLNEAVVKSITSNEPITARFLYAEWFDFYPTHKLWMATNHKPVVKGTDDGIWRRLHFIPFTVQIPPDKKEADFRQRRLEPELSGILNWALEGVRAYLAEGLNPPEVVRAATSDYRSEMDVVGDWLQERTVRTPDVQVPAADLFADYEAWAEQNCGWTYSLQRLGRQLRERGFVPAKDRGIRVWRGLRLKDYGSSGSRVVSLASWGSEGS